MQVLALRHLEGAELEVEMKMDGWRFGHWVAIGVVIVALFIVVAVKDSILSLSTNTQN